MDYVARLVRCGFSYANATWMVNEFIRKGQERELAEYVRNAEKMIEER